MSVRGVFTSCGYKKAYATRADAERAQPRQHAYRCPIADHFHTTSHRRARRRTG